MERELTEHEARELTGKIYGHLDAAWNLIIQAYYGRADKVLGYASWDDYCKTEFDGTWIRLPREQRGEVVATLTEAGLSKRAIASAIGVHHSTVDADLVDQGGGNPTVDQPSVSDPPRNVAGLDGSVRPARKSTKDAPATRRATARPKPKPVAFKPIKVVVKKPSCVKDIRPEVLERIATIEESIVNLGNETLTEDEYALLLGTVKDMLAQLKEIRHG